MINVLIVEDSAVVSALLTAIIENEADFHVVGHAKTGLEAIKLSERLDPDLITMDIRMPEMDGIEAIRAIMSTKPKPIVVISSNVDDELQISFKAIDEGALAVLEKPCSLNDPQFSSIQREMVNTIRGMAEVKLVKRRLEKKVAIPYQNKSVLKYHLVAIGSSTGGPQALKSILTGLPANFPLPIVVTQHISNGFVEGLSEWLNDSSDLRVKVAEDEEKLMAGTVYFAPDHYHCQIQHVAGQLSIQLYKDHEVNNFIPSVSRLFASVAEVCPGRAIGVILSGMGNDGADGLLAMRQAECLTVAQDEQSSIVFGMPDAAIQLNAVTKVLAAEQISHYLLGAESA